MVGTSTRACRSTGRTIRPAVVACALLIMAGFLLPGVGWADQEEKAEKRTVKDLPEYWQVWLNEEVYPLISREQRKAFISLDTEAQRKAYAERLWILWGRQTGFGSSFRIMYQDRLAFARAEAMNRAAERVAQVLRP